MGILRSYLEVFSKADKYALYVLFVLLMTYLLNQLDRYTVSITSVQVAQALKYGDKGCLRFSNVSVDYGKQCAALNHNETLCNEQFENGTSIPVCKYDYNGQGEEYQIVAGPVFILIYTFTGIFLSFFADRYQNYRVFILAFCLIFWSGMTFLMGFVTAYWQLVLLRFGQGFGQAGCTPLAASIIADYFAIELRGAAMGIYNWGIYTGYSMSFSIGNQILKYKNWEWVYFICGVPGFFVGLLMIFTVKQPKKPDVSLSRLTDESIDSTTTPKESDKLKAALKNLKIIIGEFTKPTLLFLCIAGSIRNAAGYVWAYNNNTYYTTFMHQTADQVSQYLGTIPIIFGIIGSFVGGFVSDRVAKKAKPYMRIWVLVLSQIAAAPFAAGVLYFEPPYSYFFLIPTYILGEMWVGVCLSVVVELVPEQLRTSGVGFYFFIISNIGGNMQIIVPVVQRTLKQALSLTDEQAFRGALYIFYPGEYVLGSALFLLAIFVIKRDLANIEKRKKMELDAINENDDREIAK